MTDLAALDHHRAAGGVLEAQHEAGRGLLGIGFERAGLVGDQRDLEVLRGQRRRPKAAPSAAVTRVLRTIFLP